MRITIKTRDFGALDFWMPDGGGYVRLEVPPLYGCAGRQICEGGAFLGATVLSVPDSFRRDCRKWIRQFRNQYNGQLSPIGILA